MTGVVADAGRIAWSRIGSEWRDREYDTLRRAAAALDGIELDRVDALLFAAEPTAEEARSVFADAFAAAARTEDGQLLLALYVHGRCLERWEKSEAYDPIGVLLGALGEVAGEPRPEDAPGDARAQLPAIVVGQARTIVDAMGVEDALSCSCPVAVGERARRIVGSLDALLGRERALGAGLDGPREVVRADAETTRHYFDAIATVAGAVLAFVEHDAPGRAEYLDDALAALGVPLAGDVYESELRAHRVALEALRDLAGEPRLRVDAAELVYLYPFAFAGIGAEEAVARAVGGAAVVDALASIGLGGASAHELELNDLWDRGEGSAPGYSGVTVELPPISVETTGGELLELAAEVRLSRLGNHYVRVWSRLVDAGLHEVNQALRRGSNAMGEERLASGTAEWTTFTQYAEDAIGTIASALGATPVVNPNDAFHVVLSARSISVQRPDGTTAPAALDDLERAVGASLLFHPVRHLATSLEEWIRYPAPTVRNLLAGQGYVGDLVARTDNTTVSLMPASPEWLIDEYEEMIEFVTSIPALLALWDMRAASLADHLDEALAADSSIETLHEHDLRILELEHDIREQLAFLRSSNLCRTRGQRQFLDELWVAAGLPALETELERRLTLLAERQERIAAMVSSMDERRRRQVQSDNEHLRHRAEIVLGFIAAASLAGVLQWVDQAFGVDARFWAWLEAIALVAAAVLVGTIIALGRRSA